MTEEELVQTAARLGAKEANALAGERIAQAVLARLAAEPVRPATPVLVLARRWAIGLAAAASVLLVLRLIVGTPSPRSVPSPLSSLSVLHELDGLNAAELEGLLETLPPSAAAPAHPEPAAYHDLDPKNLERLLHSLEG